MKKLFNVLFYVLISLLLITIFSFLFFSEMKILKFNIFVLVIILFISALNRKKILNSEMINTENAFMISVMAITILQYIITFSFILGRIFIRTLLR